ncbi:unnamed protein product [Tuber melanosporum]|uniref:(Perigord truffle) hypothetical protein n=1 Tax=Tuber melanosporum (strain Mel28) TaxID=656061 RepID=D5GN62_TUBMM|nr:uncharacterized protein GSTUM_00011104001 [Tuber melanosporum]CAZ85955.1 unnamed protein product [Tuber melanosporum]
MSCQFWNPRQPFLPSHPTQRRPKSALLSTKNPVLRLNVMTYTGLTLYSSAKTARELLLLYISGIASCLSSSHGFVLGIEGSGDHYAKYGLDRHDGYGDHIFGVADLGVVNGVLGPSVSGILMGWTAVPEGCPGWASM